MLAGQPVVPIPAKLVSANAYYFPFPFFSKLISVNNFGKQQSASFYRIKPKLSNSSQRVNRAIARSVRIVILSEAKNLPLADFEQQTLRLRSG